MYCHFPQNRLMILIACFAVTILQSVDSGIESRPCQAQDSTPQVTLQESNQTESAIPRRSSAVPMAECFPFEELDQADRELADKLLLDALDGEALYTLAGQIKPVSEGFFSTRFRVDPPELDELAQLSRVMRHWKCGDHLAAGVLVFENLREGERFASTWVSHRSSLARQIEIQHTTFGRLGLMPDSDPKEVLLSVERASDPGERWRGFGLLFGYPEFAVDFFVRAGLHQRETGEFVQRDFRQYPTFQRETGGMVYAVPQLTAEQPIEISLRSRVLAIQGYYRIQRAKYITDSQRQPVELLRQWFDDGTGWCHPDHAIEKVLSIPGLQLGVWTADYRGASDATGAKVTSVIPGSAADVAGIKNNDVIRSLNEVPIQSAQSYLEQVAMLIPNQQITLSIDRLDSAKESQSMTVQFVVPESLSFSDFMQEPNHAILER